MFVIEILAAYLLLAPNVVIHRLGATCNWYFRLKRCRRKAMICSTYLPCHFVFPYIEENEWEISGKRKQKRGLKALISSQHYMSNKRMYSIERRYCTFMYHIPCFLLLNILQGHQRNSGCCSRLYFSLLLMLRWFWFCRFWNERLWLVTHSKNISSYFKSTTWKRGKNNCSFVNTLEIAVYFAFFIIQIIGEQY